MTEKRETEGWPPDEEIRDRVGQAMADWNADSNFAEVLSGLMAACPFLDNTSFARLYRERTGRPLHPTEIGRYRRG